MDCPTLWHFEDTKNRKSPVWVMYREGDDELRVEFGIWSRVLRLELAGEPRGLNARTSSTDWRLTILSVIPQSSLLATTVLDAAPAMLITCVESDGHGGCSGFNTEQQKLPTRVIDIGNGTDLPFLFITNGEVERYCTLSYCWGLSSTAYNTTRDNLAARKKELPIVSLN
jgi:hypothetical protein